jgi:hypothetical protein
VNISLPTLVGIIDRARANINMDLYLRLDGLENIPPPAPASNPGRTLGNGLTIGRRKVKRCPRDQVSLGGRIDDDGLGAGAVLVEGTTFF